MKPILLLQYRTDSSREHEQQCLAKKLNISPPQLDIRNVILNQDLPLPQQLQNYSGVIGGASGQFNITDWSAEVQQSVEKSYPLLHEIIEKDIPYLGICFSHQLLAHMLGSPIKRDSHQMESESTHIQLSISGQHSQLYQNLSTTFYACNGHKESVMKQPTGSTLLARSQRCHVQSYQIKNNIFTTQFHPELDLEDVRFRLNLTQEYCFGNSVETVLAKYKDISQSGIILKNFRSVMEKYQLTYGLPIK